MSIKQKVHFILVTKVKSFISVKRDIVNTLAGNWTQAIHSEANLFVHYQMI